MQIDSRIKFRHLLCFLEVARLRNLTRAAEALGITQPAASKTLRELEETLGVRLFDRSGRKMRLTGEGQIFLRHAGASVAALRRGVDGISAGRGMVQRLRVGVLPTVATRTMPRAALRFADLRPDVLLSVDTGPNGHLLDRLKTGDLDLVVGRMAAPEQMTGLSFEHLYSEAVRAVVRPGHPLLGGPVDLAALSAFPMILPTPDSIIRPALDRFLLANGLHSDGVRLETISLAFGRGIVRSTDSVWFISEGVVAAELEARLLSALDLPMPEAVGAVGLTTRVERGDDDALRMLMDALRAGGERAFAHEKAGRSAATP